MNPSNEWSGHYFMSLSTGKQLYTYIWTQIIICEQLIHRVDELSKKGKDLQKIKGYPIFEWSPGIKSMYQAYSEPENEEELLHNNEENDDMK